MEADDRLTRADSWHHQPYQHPDLDRLITRVTQPSRAPRRVGRGFQLRVGASLLASALVTVGAIAALDGAGPGLSVLSLSATGFTSNVTPTSTRFAAAAGAAPNYTFVAGTTLSDAATPTPSYRLTTPTSPAREVVRLSRLFQVSGTPLHEANTTDWSISNGHGQLVQYDNANVPQWRYFGPVTALNGTLPTRATVERDAADFLRRLGYAYTLATPYFMNLSVTSSVSTATMPVVAASYPVVIAHVRTDQTLALEFNARNQLVQASGPAITATTGVAYPLQSPHTALSELSPRSRSGEAISSHPSPSTLVRVIGATVSLRTYQLSDGELWLLPVYSFHTTSGANRMAGPTRLALALDPRYVSVSAASRTKLLTP